MTQSYVYPIETIMHPVNGVIRHARSVEAYRQIMQICLLIQNRWDHLYESPLAQIPDGTRAYTLEQAEDLAIKFSQQADTHAEAAVQARQDAVFWDDLELDGSEARHYWSMVEHHYGAAQEAAKFAAMWARRSMR